VDQDNLHKCIVSSGQVHLAPCQYVQVIATSSSDLKWALQPLSYPSHGTWELQHPFGKSSTVRT